MRLGIAVGDATPLIQAKTASIVATQVTLALPIVAA
jgi:hypothetical protein